MQKRLLAEAIGSFALVSVICGTLVGASTFPGLSAGIVGISLAAGLTMLAMSSAFGCISGAHFNPAVSFGAWVAGRLSPQWLAGYVAAQLVGAVLATAMLFAVFMSIPGFEAAAFASNGYGNHSPGGYGLQGAAITEVVATAIFVLAVLGASHDDSPAFAGPVAAGLALAAVHLWTLPITGTSVNPARSTATVVFAEGWALQQLWVFWAAPLAGAALAGLVDRFVLANALQFDTDDASSPLPPPPIAKADGDELQPKAAG